MKKQKAIEHFGSAAAVGRAIGKTRAAVSKWDDVVPLKHIWILREKSGYKLALRLSDYRTRPVE